MPLEIKVQLNIVIYAMLAGLLTGIIFDLYRIIRGGKIPKVIIVIEDFLFFIFAAVTIFTFLLYTNYAFLSVYVYAFILVSLLLYFRLVSPTILKYEIKIGKGIYFFTRVLFKRLAYTFKLIYYSISGKKQY